MKVLVALCLVLGLLEVAFAVPLLTEKWPIPNKDGDITWMTEDEASLEALAEMTEMNSRKPNDIKFFLYTQNNTDEAQEIIYGDLNSLKKSNFNSSHPTRISVHGWGGKWNDSQNNLIKNSYLKNGRNDKLNVIIVDWSVYSDASIYFSAKSKCSVAGEHLATLIDWLHSVSGLKFSDVNLNGHSLGAHVVGFAGKKVSKGRINIIYGLDPAMPFYSYENTNERLSTTDAVYVETIHTNGGLKGFYQPIGNASFYVNGGKKQPGCGLDLQGVCSHARAVEYFAEAVRLGPKNQFNPAKCSSFDDVAKETCDIHVTGIRMGDPSNYGKANGIYYLKTNSQAPFGLGNKEPFRFGIKKQD